MKMLPVALISALSVISLHAQADQPLPIHMKCYSNAVRADASSGFYGEQSPIVELSFVNNDPVLPYKGDGTVKIPLDGGYWIEAVAQAEMGQSLWMDKKDDVFFTVSLMRLEASGQTTVLAVAQGNTDNLGSSDEAKLHSHVNIGIDLNLVNPEIKTAGLKSLKDLGQDLSIEPGVLVQKGYIADKTVMSASLDCVEF